MFGFLARLIAQACYRVAIVAARAAELVTRPFEPEFALMIEVSRHRSRSPVPEFFVFDALDYLDETEGRPDLFEDLDAEIRRGRAVEDLDEDLDDEPETADAVVRAYLDGEREGGPRACKTCRGN